MKQKHWFKPKPFTHLTPKLSWDDMKWVEQYVSNPSNIESHKFFPLLHRTIALKRFKWSYDKNSKQIKRHYTFYNGHRKSNVKYREIYYPNHLDSHIYSYYSREILEPRYNNELLKNKQLDESVIAYRRIAVEDHSRCKCNIDFANDVFESIKNYEGECAVLCLDISKFFDSLDHKHLKKAWANLLERKDLPEDHYSIFKSVTSFSFIEIKHLLNEFNYKHPNKLIQKNINSFCANAEQFRNRVKRKGFIKKNPFRRQELDHKVAVGIPQGTPISSFLANLYLLEFDKKIIDLIGLHSIYRRYSDDILIICPRSEYDIIENKVYDLIREYKLTIQKEKTQRSFFINGRLHKGEKPVNYLGFQFDGSRKLLRSSSIAKFYRKMKASIKYRASCAYKAKKKREKGIDVDASLYRKKLYNQFSYLGLRRNKSLRKRNYFSYANYASEIMKSPQIKNQLSNAWSILHSEIDRYEIRYGLQKLK